MSAASCSWKSTPASCRSSSVARRDRQVAFAGRHVDGEVATLDVALQWLKLHFVDAARRNVFKLRRQPAVRRRRVDRHFAAPRSEPVARQHETERRLVLSFLDRHDQIVADFDAADRSCRVAAR